MSTLIQLHDAVGAEMIMYAHTHTHARARTHTHTHTHAHTRKHTHVGFLSECPSPSLWLKNLPRRHRGN